MVAKASPRSMPLRELLTHTEKCSRDLIDYFRAYFKPVVGDFRQLTRPNRGQSSYPTLVAMQNGLHRAEAAGQEALQQAEYLAARLKEIYRHARLEEARRYRIR